MTAILHSLSVNHLVLITEPNLLTHEMSTQWPSINHAALINIIPK